MCAHVMMHMCWVEDNLLGSVLSFHLVGFRDQIQVTVLGGKNPYPLSHLVCIILSYSFLLSSPHPSLFKKIYLFMYSTYMSAASSCTPEEGI